MRDNDGKSSYDYSQRRQSSDDGDNAKKVIGASSRLYPGPDHQRAHQAKIIQQRKAMAEAAAARMHQGSHFPAVPANKVALQPTVATLMMPMSLTARRNLGGRMPTLRNVGQSMLDTRSLAQGYYSQQQAQAQQQYLARQQAQAQAQNQFWKNLTGNDGFLGQKPIQPGVLPLQPQQANYRHAVNPRKNTSRHFQQQQQQQQQQQLINHVPHIRSHNQGSMNLNKDNLQRDHTHMPHKQYTSLTSHPAKPEPQSMYEPLQEQHFQQTPFAERFYPRAKMMRGKMLSQNKHHSIEHTWRPLGT